MVIMNISSETKRRIFLPLLLIAISIAPAYFVHAQPCYKEGTGYLLKEVDPSAPFFFNRYKYGQIASYYSRYYIVGDEDLCRFFKNDSVNFNQTVFLCDPVFAMFTDSAITRDVKRFTRIKDILALNDSEIYEIGGNKYLIRKIRYAYYDNTQVKVYIKGYNYYAWDDITDEDTTILNSTFDVGLLFGRTYYQCYHHLIELLPTPEYFSRYLWRRLYQLGTEK